MMTATPITNVAPKNMEEAYIMLYGKIGEIRYSNSIVWMHTPKTNDSKSKKN